MPTSSAAAQLPAVLLQGKQVAQSVLEVIPFATAERFQVVVYAQDEDQIKLAIVHPEQLKQGFYEALNHIGEKIGKKIILAKTDPNSFQSVMKQYRSYVKQEKKEKAPIPVTKMPVTHNKPESNDWPSVPNPPLFELGKLVAYNYLRRIPLEFAKKERLLSVDFLRPNIYWFVTDGTNDSRLKKAIHYISENNHIVIHMLVIQPKQFDDLLGYYGALMEQDSDTQEEKFAEDTVDKQREEEEAIERKLAELSKPEDAFETGSHRVAKDVIMPGIQAQIISGETEKKGLAGFLQKITQNFAAQESEKNAETATPYTAPPGLKGAPTITPLVKRR